MDPESRQELPLLLLWPDGHVRLPASLCGILCHVFSHTDSVWPEEKSGETQIWRADHKTRSTNILVGGEFHCRQYPSNSVYGIFLLNIYYEPNIQCRQLSGRIECFHLSSRPFIVWWMKIPIVIILYASSWFCKYELIALSCNWIFFRGAASFIYCMFQIWRSSIMQFNFKYHVFIPISFITSVT